MREWFKRRKKKRRVRELIQTFDDNSLVVMLYGYEDRKDIVSIGERLINLGSQVVIPGMFGMLDAVRVRRMKNE